MFIHICANDPVVDRQSFYKNRFSIEGLFFLNLRTRFRWHDGGLKKNFDAARNL